MEYKEDLVQNEIVVSLVKYPVPLSSGEIKLMVFGDIFSISPKIGENSSWEIFVKIKQSFCSDHVIFEFNSVSRIEL